MNLDEYRALVAKEKEDEGKPTVEEVETKEEETTTAEVIEEEEVDSKPETIEIDGEEFTLEELKGGYMRQSDYTRKTQELSRRERQVQEAIEFMEQVQKNPQVAQELSTQFEMPNLDPNQSQYRELEDRYYELLIQTEVEKLNQKYGEFDVQAVLETARDNNINDLDVAYHIVASRKGGGRTQANNDLDVDKLKAQLREELLNEMKSQQQANADTSTIVGQGGGGAPIRDNTPQISEAESKVARSMGISVAEYVKWRDG